MTGTGVIVKQNRNVLVFLFLSCQLVHYGSTDIADAVQTQLPLGKHKDSEGTIDEFEGFPNPEYFYKNYIKASRPLLFKDGAKLLPAFTLWTDKYLGEKYGDEEIEVELGKKENRDHGGATILLSKFLKVYNSTNIYMVQDAKESMLGDLSLLPPLQCGGLQHNIQQAILWFSSGGTKSVLHRDELDNINCILDGDKDIIFIDKKYAPDVEESGWIEDGQYSKLDVDAVDNEKFPQFARVPWTSAKMKKGDCLFIPYKWFHTVKSSKQRNLAVNLWFAHLLWFNKTDCEEKPSINAHVGLDTTRLLTMDSNTETLRLELFQHMENYDVIGLPTLVEHWSFMMEDATIQVLFEFIDTNKDFELSWDEIYKLDMMEMINEFPEIFRNDQDTLNNVPDHEEL